MLISISILILILIVIYRLRRLPPTPELGTLHRLPKYRLVGSLGELLEVAWGGLEGAKIVPTRLPGGSCDPPGRLPGPSWEASWTIFVKNEDAMRS